MAPAPNAPGSTPAAGRRRGTGLEFYWDEFLTGFCRHLPLPLVLLLLVALLSGQVGTGFGVPYALKYEEEGALGWLKQFWVGFALAAVVLECLFIGFLLRIRGRSDRTVAPHGPAPQGQTLSPGPRPGTQVNGLPAAPGPV